MVGSSRNRMSGSCGSAAISARMRCPSDNWRTGWSSRRSSCSSATSSSRVRSAPGRPGRYRAAGRSRRRPGDPTTAACAARTPRRCAPRASAVGEGHAPVDLDAATVGPQDARQHLDGGRLAGAVRPDEAEQLAALQRERHVGQRLHRAIARPRRARRGRVCRGRAHGCDRSCADG